MTLCLLCLFLVPQYCCLEFFHALAYYMFCLFLDFYVFGFIMSRIFFIFYFHFLLSFGSINKAIDDDDGEASITSLSISPIFPIS